MRALRALGLAAIALAACQPPAPKPPPRTPPPEARPAPGKPASIPNPLVLSLMPVLQPEQIGRQFGAFAAHLGDSLGTTIELRIAASYEDAIADATEGRTDVAQLSPLAYVEAKNRLPALYPLAANISEGSSTYSGYLVARRTLELRRPEQLAGRVLGLVEPHSASGYLYPYAFLLDRGIDPEKECTIKPFARHDLLIRALAEGRIDVGGTFAGAINNAEKNGVDTSGFEIIAKTGRIPHDAWVARPTLPADVHDAVQHVLLNLSTRNAEGRRVLGPIESINTFAEVEDAHYDRVRQELRRVRRATPKP